MLFLCCVLWAHRRSVYRQVIISAQAHKLVKGHFTTMELFKDHYCRVIKDQRYTPMRKQNKVNMLQQSLDDPLLEVKVKGYIPGAVLRNLRPDSPEDEHWSNEVTVFFFFLFLQGGSRFVYGVVKVHPRNWTGYSTCNKRFF